MSSIYSQDFVGTAGTAVTVEATSTLSGAGGTLTYVQDPVLGAGAKAVAAAGFALTYSHSYATAVANAYLSGLIVVPAGLASPVFFVNCFGDVNANVADLRLNVDGSVTVRDTQTARASSPAIPAGTLVRWRLQVKPGSTTGLKLQLFIGANVGGTTPDYDSGGVKSTATDTVIRGHRDGSLVSQTGSVTLIIGRLRADDAAMPPGPTAGTPPTVTLAAASATVEVGGTDTLTATATPAGSAVISAYTWRPIGSDTPRVLTAAGATATLTSPTVRVPTSGTYGVIVTDSTGASAAEKTVTVTFLPVTEWYWDAAGVERPMAVQSLSTAPVSTLTTQINGDGTVTFSGVGATTNPDGTATLSSPTWVANSNGTYTLSS